MKPHTTSPKTPRTYRVKSFGCQMNVYDGERMGELLAEKGIVPAPDGEETASISPRRRIGSSYMVA